MKASGNFFSSKQVWQAHVIRGMKFYSLPPLLTGDVTDTRLNRAFASLFMRLMRSSRQVPAASSLFGNGFLTNAFCLRTVHLPESSTRSMRYIYLHPLHPPTPPLHPHPLHPDLRSLQLRPFLHHGLFLPTGSHRRRRLRLPCPARCLGLRAFRRRHAGRRGCRGCHGRGAEASVHVGLNAGARKEKTTDRARYRVLSLQQMKKEIEKNDIYIYI